MLSDITILETTIISNASSMDREVLGFYTVDSPPHTQSQILPGVSGAYTVVELDAVMGSKLNEPQALHSFWLMSEQMATLPSLTVIYHSPFT